MNRILILILLAAFTANAAPRIQVTRGHVRIQGVAAGQASWYGDSWNGKTMANGQAFRSGVPTAASYQFKLGQRVRVTNIRNGKSIVLPITDRGPNRRLGRLIDLSQSAARELGYEKSGLTLVSVEVQP